MDNFIATLVAPFNGALEVDGNNVRVNDEQALRDGMDGLVNAAVFGAEGERDMARWLIWQAGQAMGVFPSSIHELYMAVGRGELPHDFTVPAMNIRVMAYDTMRALFRAANRLNVGAFLLEIARSEMGYTDQRPAEYVSVALAAAMREGFRGPLFIQGDHFQLSAKNYKADAAKELQSVKDLIAEAVAAGFYNIDIDSSTLVDLAPETLAEQQRLNVENCALLTEYVREVEPEGVTVSVGGEIGEVGGHNSTVEELHAFMQGYRDALAGYSPYLKGISKISVQTGTSHGGVVLPDGTLASVNVDFDTLRELGRIAREEYAIGGAVQHGASTLPPEAFDRFPAIGTLEIHLATGFQNIAFDHAPEALLAKASDYVNANLQSERKASDTDSQFHYSARKKSIGPMKRDWWALSEADRAAITEKLEAQFAFLFEKLNANDTRELVARTVTPAPQQRARPQAIAQEADLNLASDLSD